MKSQNFVKSLANYSKLLLVVLALVVVASCSKDEDSPTKPTPNYEVTFNVENATGTGAPTVGSGTLIVRGGQVKNPAGTFVDNSSGISIGKDESKTFRFTAGFNVRVVKENSFDADSAKVACTGVLEVNDGEGGTMNLPYGGSDTIDVSLDLLTVDGGLPIIKVIKEGAFTFTFMKTF